VSTLDNVLPSLRCPHCCHALSRAGGAVGCDQHHSFDLARQGYLSLLAGAGPAHTGDTAQMVAARERFLAAGHFAPLAGALVQAVALAPALAVDLGSGPGWYLARILDRFPAAIGLALDVSKPALRRAGRAHDRIAAVACDAWRPLPLRDAVADVVLNVFAPRNGAEVARVLAPGGAAVVVTPAPGHLEEITGALGLLSVGNRKDERLAEQLAPGLQVTGRQELEWKLRLDRAAARDAAAMGPSAFHVSAAELDERIATLPELVEVTAAARITTATAPTP
jgi:23S rRNA (guanine745-N1)-methyltransferase